MEYWNVCSRIVYVQLLSESGCRLKLAENLIAMFVVFYA